MTEQEWLTIREPIRLMGHLANQGSTRKWRLFSAACCWRLWAVRQVKSNRRLLESYEEFADGMISERELSRQSQKWERKQGIDFASWRRAMSWAISSGQRPAQSWFNARMTLDAIPRLTGEPLHQCQLLRDIFGNPFRSVTVEVAWLTSTVVSLAQTVYDKRAFDRLPILGDALEDAGCDNADILNHCRSDGPHVRGCWVVDALLAKK